MGQTNCVSPKRILFTGSPAGVANTRALHRKQSLDSVRDRFRAKRELHGSGQFNLNDCWPTCKQTEGFGCSCTLERRLDFKINIELLNADAKAQRGSCAVKKKRM
ncbi:hypothetical protein CEXT_227201 [Caerostris extrusa]|uniref:Uncharacterized protein n=1 Tax=Caerostris extrusa TaxID=172846 RepID=A0AAV4NAE2_CAEEX|nr:hypothetical protein CEXT_227201 [Caerostris extrusa]